MPDEELPSKSELKRQMHARQALGEKIAQLAPMQLAKLPLDDALRAAIADYHRFKHKEARRRQMQFIGKLMRTADVDAIELAFSLTQAGSEAAKKREHRIERWREQLLSEGDEAIGRLVEECPALDRQQLRQLVREAQRQQLENKPPAASRKLFKILREHLQ
jgi:ribosome-associated protein